MPHDLAALLSSPLCLPLAAVARRLRQEAARAAGREEEEEGEGGAAAAPSEAEEGAAVLALYGWEAGVLAAPSSSSSSAAAVGWVLGCGLCGRRVEAARLLARRSSASLSPRKGPGGTSPARRTRGGGAPAQAQGEGEGEGGKVEFDPVEQHRYYCPWATVAMEGGEGAAGAEADAGAEAGWRQLAKVVASRTPRAWFLPGGWDGEGGVDGAVPSQWQLPQKPDDMYNAAMDLLHSF